MSDEEQRAAQTNAEDAKAAEAPATPAAVAEDVNDVQFEDSGAAEPQNSPQSHGKNRAENSVRCTRRSAEKPNSERESLKR